MSYDFNDAGPQSSGGGEPIPKGTVAPVIINLRGIKAGKTDSRVQGLDIEYTVTAGPYAKQKAWGWHGVAGNGSDGHNKMVSITRSYIRAVIESAFGIDPADDSQEAMNGRRISDWQDLDGLEFVARFDIEEGTDFTDQRTGEARKGKDKNTLRAVTPDDPDYNGFKPAKRKAGGAAPKGATAAKQPATAGANGFDRPNWG
jgi:hypothetical protein